MGKTWVTFGSCGAAIGNLGYSAGALGVSGDDLGSFGEADRKVLMTWRVLLGDALEGL